MPRILGYSVVVMASSNSSPLEALRADAERIFELVFETGTAKQWGHMLTAPLECAVLRGDEDMVQKLVGAGASMGGSVHAAVESGSEEMMGYLLTHGGSVNSRDASGDRPLHTAARTGKPELARSLLLRGADVNVSGKEDATPLYWAAQYGHLGVVKALLAAGADVTLGLYGLERPLETAAEHGHTDIVKALIESGSDVNFVGVDGNTALQSAVLSQESEVIDALVEAGANMEQRHVVGYAPLHTAVHKTGTVNQKGRLDAILSLLKHGADVNVAGWKYIEGQTPLHVVARLAAGGSGKPDDAGHTPEVVDALLRWGADETIVDRDGKTAVDFLDRDFDGQHRLQVVQRVRKLLVNAPADRAWRRRGYLVLCRAYPERVQLSLEGGQSDAGMARKTRSRARRARMEAGADINSSGAAGGDTLANDDEFGRLANRVVGLKEDGIFRTIVGYL